MPFSSFPAARKIIITESPYLFFMTSRSISKGYFLLSNSVLACVPNSCLTCFLFSVIVISYLLSFFYILCWSTPFILHDVSLLTSIISCKDNFVELSTKIGEHLGTFLKKIPKKIFPWINWSTINFMVFDATCSML